MKKDRVFATFGSLPIGTQFIDPRWDELCIKSSDVGAKDRWCATGFEITFVPSEVVIVG